MPVKIIDNFGGRLTRDNIGDMNSGLAVYDTTFGANSFANPGNLTWFEQPTSVLTINNGGIMAARVRLENGQDTYVYAISGDTTGPTIYKITANDSSQKNANLDSASVIGMVPSENASTIGALYGSSLQFYGSPEKMYMGLDERIVSANFTGSVLARLTQVASITTNVPRPSAQFLGKMYWGNGNNLIEIDSTETITSYAKLSPGFPVGTYIRDLDVSPDGNYLQITVSKNNSPSLGQFTADYSAGASQEAYKFLWNGTDAGVTSAQFYPGYSLTANTVFGQENFTMGTDMNGAALYSGSNKIYTLPNVTPPNFGSTYSFGNLLGMVTPEYNSSVTGANPSSVVGLQASGFFYGQYDKEIPGGLFRAFKQSAASGNNEVVHVPVSLPVSNLVRTYQGAGYANNIVSMGKIYLSTIENSGSNIKGKLYKFFTVPTGINSAIGGVYQTQQETSLKLFRSIITRKFKPNSVRFYVVPLLSGNSFQIDIIGSDGNAMPGGTQTFTVGTNATAGQDYVWYSPQTAPTYSMGFRITNLGTVNWTGVKLEVDYEEAGV